MSLLHLPLLFSQAQGATARREAAYKTRSISPAVTPAVTSASPMVPQHRSGSRSPICPLLAQLSSRIARADRSVSKPCENKRGPLLYHRVPCTQSLRGDLASN